MPSYELWLLVQDLANIPYFHKIIKLISYFYFIICLNFFLIFPSLVKEHPWIGEICIIKSLLPSTRKK